MTKPVLILIAGWAHESESLRGLSDCLGDFFSVVMTSVYELASVGRHRLSYVEGLQSMLMRLDDKAVVAGWSLGGMIALETAARNPDLFRALALIGASAKFCSDVSCPEGVDSSRLSAMSLGLIRNRRRTLIRFFKDASAPFMDQELENKVAIACSMDRDVLLDGLEYLKCFDVTGSLAKMDVPTIVFHGREDRIVPYDSACFLAERLQGCRLVQDALAGHTLPIRNPNDVAVEICRFLDLMS